MNDSEPVIVASFSSAADAELARGRLEAEGILALVGDGEMTTLLVPNVVGGAKLLVAGDDAWRAKMLLAEWRRAGQAAAEGSMVRSLTGDEILCLACGAPIPVGESRCGECGWTYLEADGKVEME